MLQKLEDYCPGLIVIALSVVMYAATYSKLKEHSKNLALQNSTRNKDLKIKEKQFIKTIIRLIAFIAFVSSVPPITNFQLEDSLRSFRNIIWYT
jgi:hypothetical protein